MTAAGDPARAAGFAPPRAPAAVSTVRAGEAVAVPYAGFVTRTLAFAADAAIINFAAALVATVVALVLSVLPESQDMRAIVVAAGTALYVLWTLGYFSAFWTTTGVTPGNRAMRIRVVRADGSALRLRHALVRLAGMVLGLPLFAGYVPILVTERRRGLHDAMAGTVVVSLPVTRPG